MWKLVSFFIITKFTLVRIINLPHGTCHYVRLMRLSVLQLTNFWLVWYQNFETLHITFFSYEFDLWSKSDNDNTCQGCDYSHKYNKLKIIHFAI